MRRVLLCFLVSTTITFFVGCDSNAPAGIDPAPTPSNSEKPTKFDVHACGNITGLVTWVGPIPEVAPATHVVRRPDGNGFDTHLVPFANAPHVDQFTRALEGTVVFLREVDPTNARPWDLPPATVEFRQDQLVVKQGTRVARAGFVRRGESVEIRSAESYMHVLRGRGAAFFSLAFPEPDKPLIRTFDSCGRIELTSADGCYWQFAELFVCDHPYYAITDAEGRFHFPSVPAGKYDLVTWHPNWNAVHTERNPETGLPSRFIYGPPLESSRPVVVSRKHTTLANLTLPK